MEASNLQELKDAAIELIRFTCNSCERRICEEDAEEEDGRSVPSPCSAIIRMRNALSANPIRNCDVGTAEKQSIRFDDYCHSLKKSENRCRDCALNETINFCALEWGQMPYEKGGSL